VHRPTDCSGRSQTSERDTLEGTSGAQGSSTVGDADLETTRNYVRNQRTVHQMTPSHFSVGRTSRTEEVGERFIEGLEMDLQTIRSVEECVTIEDYIAFLNIYSR
jgi:hypothetical protein